MVGEKYRNGRNPTVHSVSLPSPCCSRMAAALSHNNTPKKSKNFVVADEELAKIQRRIKEVGVMSPVPVCCWVTG